MKILILLGIALFFIVTYARRRPDTPAPPATAPDKPAPLNDEQLARYKAVIDANRLPAQKIVLTGEPAAAPHASKIGGQPYWTAGLE